MKITLRLLLVLLLFGGIFACRELYTPPVISNNSNYLVVEGMINTTDSTFIKLSRTVQLSSKTTVKTETKAKITIESNANTSYPLKEITTGTYATAPLALSKAGQYRLRILTSDGKTYLSDFVPVKESPAIDSIGYSVLPTGLQIYANTHDQTNNTRYYRWDYTETWEIHSRYQSSDIATKTNIVPRTPNQQIFRCWPSMVSPDIVLASSEKLTQDVINQSVITTVPPVSEKLGWGYSILVKQYTLTEDAFNFWQNLKKNTEQLGSIFDAQPSEIQGNIHNINNAAEPVFGYISAGTVQQKRITMLNTSWPTGWGTGNTAFYNDNCIYDIDFFTVIVNNPGKVPISEEPNSPGYYSNSSPLCVDCTVRAGAGTNKKPSYWPN